MFRPRAALVAVIALAVLAGSCGSSDRPTLGDEVAAPEVARRNLDPTLTYLAVTDGEVPVYASSDVAVSDRSVAPADPADARSLEGFVLAAPYEAAPGRHEVFLPDGTRAWVEDADVEVRETNVVAIGRGTEVDSAGGGGGEVAIYGRRGAPEPTQQITNPKSAEGLSVGPVVFLAAGPYDPSAKWLKVYLPIRPNGSTGFVKAADVDISANRFRIEVGISEHTIRLFDSDKLVLEEPIGVGLGNTPTPGGVFYIRSLIASTDPAYGTYAFGLSGFSEVHESFNGGPGDIGIHGTNDPSSVGVDSSNGCIRLEDETVIHLAEVLPEADGPDSDSPQVSTGLGVPVEVKA